MLYKSNAHNVKNTTKNLVQCSHITGKKQSREGKSEMTNKTVKTGIIIGHNEVRKLGLQHIRKVNFTKEIQNTCLKNSG